MTTEPKTTGKRVQVYLTAAALKIWESIPDSEKSAAVQAAMIAQYGQGADAAKAKLQALLIQAK